MSGYGMGYNHHAASYDSWATREPWGDVYIEETDEEDGFEWGWEDEEPELIEEGPLFNEAFKHSDYGGVAFFGDGYRAGKIECHMIGDDRTFVFDPADCTLLDSGEFCWDCGQVGCYWHTE